jgi:hypothetical protein
LILRLRQESGKAPALKAGGDRGAGATHRAERATSDRCIWLVLAGSDGRSGHNARHESPGSEMPLRVGENAMRKLFSIAIGLLAAVGAAVTVSVCMAILEIYLAGHGHPTLMDRIVFEHPDSGTRLSIPDVIVLVISAMSGIVATWLNWPGLQRRGN